MATTADEVWQLLGELVASQKETDRRMQETDRRMQETDRRMEESKREADRRFQETERLLKEQSQKTDQQIRTVNKELGELGNRLGEFVEWQVRPAAVRLFRERGIAVREISRDVSVDNGEEGIDVDVLVVDTTQAVAIEVKSRLTQRDVDEHLERLGKFKRLLPRYENIQLMGAVAAMVATPEVARYAYRQGLFVLTQSGEDLVILNDVKFRPKTW